MYSEIDCYFLNLKEGSFKNDLGKEITYARLTVCDSEGAVESYTILPEDRPSVRRSCEVLQLFAPVNVSLYIKGHGTFMKAYACDIKGKEV